MSVIGPYEDERQARGAAMDIAAGLGIRPVTSILSEDQRRKLLLEACKAAGVELGTYDERIIRWLANWEDSTVAVVSGLIERVYGAGRACH